MRASRSKRSKEPTVLSTVITATTLCHENRLGSIDSRSTAQQLRLGACDHGDNVRSSETLLDRSTPRCHHDRRCRLGSGATRRTLSGMWLEAVRRLAALEQRHGSTREQIGGHVNRRIRSSARKQRSKREQRADLSARSSMLRRTDQCAGIESIGMHC